MGRSQNHGPCAAECYLTPLWVTFSYPQWNVTLWMWWFSKYCQNAAKQLPHPIDPHSGWFSYPSKPFQTSPSPKTVAMAMCINYFETPVPHMPKDIKRYIMYPVYRVFAGECLIWLSHIIAPMGWFGLVWKDMKITHYQWGEVAVLLHSGNILKTATSTKLHFIVV